MADKENLPPTPPSLSSITLGLRPWHVSPFASPPLRAISPNSRPALSRQRDHSACGRPETPLKVRKTRENLRDTRAYPELPPPCSHPFPHPLEVPSHYGSGNTEFTLPSYHTEDVTSMPPPPHPLVTSRQPKIQRHKSISRRMLSVVKQGINNRSKTSLSIRPIESDTSLIRRLSGRRKQSSENERCAQSFEISRDSIISTGEDDVDDLLEDAYGGKRSCTDSTLSTSELTVDTPFTPGSGEHRFSSTGVDGAATSSSLPAPHELSPGHTPRPLNGRCSSRTASTGWLVVVPYVELTVTTELSAVDAGAEQEVWVAVDAVVRRRVHDRFGSDRGGSNPDAVDLDGALTDAAVVGAITSLRLCYKPVGKCSVLDVVGQKALKDVGIGQGCTVFVRARVPRIKTDARPPETDQSFLLAELESIVGTLETEVLHVEARYRSSLLPYSNVVTVRQTVNMRRPKTESRWSIVGTYSDMETSEQVYTKLAVYLADSYPPDKALRYIDRYLGREAEQAPVQQIRQKLVDDSLRQQGISANAGSTAGDERNPTVVVTDIDLTSAESIGDIAEKYASTSSENTGTRSSSLAACAPRTKSRSTSLYAIPSYNSPLIAALSPSKSTMAITEPDASSSTDTDDDARRLWHHIRRSSLSARQLVEMAPERLQHLEAGDEALSELRRRAVANKRSVGAEILRQWKWDGQVMSKLGDAPWL